MPHRAYLRALWPKTAFDVPAPEGTWRRLRIVARRPGGTGEGAPRGRVAAAVFLDGRRLGDLPLTERWGEHTLRLPDAGAAAATGGLDIRRLTITWPPPGDAGPDPMAAAVDRLAAGLEAELHAVFGELFSLRLLR